jgi:GNAT superfamily N-acetyltransferase
VTRDIYPIIHPTVRPAYAADAEAITAVRRASWRAAYDGIIDRAVLERVTARAAVSANPPPYRRTLVAVAGELQAVIGYASHGPERMVVTAVPPPFPAPAGTAPADTAPAGTVPAGTGTASAGVADASASTLAGELTAAGAAGQTGELYALYVTPDWWSAGAGRALLATVVAALRAAGYRRAVLWTLTRNARARRFYEKAGFAPDGTTSILTGLGDVEELRYARDLLASANCAHANRDRVATGQRLPAAQPLRAGDPGGRRLPRGAGGRHPADRRPGVAAARADPA